jgi:hypothetical protein
MTTTTSIYNQIQVGSRIKLKDEVTLKECLAARQGVGGVDYVVREVWDIEQLNKSFILKVFKLENAGDITYLVYKIVDDIYDVRVYNQLDWLEEGTRKDILGAGHFFLFRDPGTTEFVPAELSYSYNIILTVEGKDFEYVEKYESDTGELTHEPRQAGLVYPIFTQFKEYSTTEVVDNPEILILEVGGLRDGQHPIDAGGWVNVMEGRIIDDTDYQIF